LGLSFKYRNLTSLKEIRALTNTSQAVFTLILDTSRKHYLEIEKNPALLGDRPVQTIYHLALFFNCRVKQLFPIHLIQRYQAEAQACASNFLRTNPVNEYSGGDYTSCPDFGNRIFDKFILLI
jgi:DNA-binding XRE family transcriptional regulator